MAVKTHFSHDELRAILAEYDVGEFHASQGFEHGADQTNILLTTLMGKYAFRYYEKRPEDYVRFEIALLRFLGERSYPCPAPIRLRDGRYFGLHNGKPYALFTFQEGEHDDRIDNYRLVAPALAWLHNLTRAYRPPTPRHGHHTGQPTPAHVRRPTRRSWLTHRRRRSGCAGSRESLLRCNSPTTCRRAFATAIPIVRISYIRTVSSVRCSTLTRRATRGSCMTLPR